MMERIATVLFVLAAAGCGSSGPRAEGACADLAHARCGRLAACSSFAVAIRYGDAATCEARETANCVAALAAPGTGNNPGHAEACAQAIGAWSCPGFLDGTGVPQACAQPTGSEADGQPCAFPAQCHSGFCAIVPGSACGTCAAAPAAGASCAELTTCGQGLVCTSDTRTCVAYGGTAGASCGRGAPCGAGLSCVGAHPAAGTPGTCQPSATQAGASCDPTLETGAGCDRNAGLVCNSSTRQCAAATIAATGQPCGDVNDQTAFCAASATCTGSSPGHAGTCSAAAADGAACDTASGPDCQPLARCITGPGTTAGTCHMNDASTCAASGPGIDGGVAGDAGTVAAEAHAHI